MQRSIAIFCLFFLMAAIVQAQVHRLDSTSDAYHGSTSYGYSSGMDASLHFLFRKDTNIRMLQEYDPTYLANLGAVGLPAIPLFFDPAPEPGFQFGLHPWDAYRITRDNVPYFNTQNPYTDLFYVQGPVMFQELRGIHTQNIRPNWNFAVTFNKLGNGGFYSNQKNVHNQIGFTTWYRSLSQRYQILGSFIYNGFQQQENGGIADLPYFVSAGLTARTRAPVFLNSDGQKWREVDYNIAQYFFLGPASEFRIHDTDKAVKYIHPHLYISHTFNIHRTRYLYTGGTEDALYFDTSYISSSATHDSIWQRRISNEVSLGWLGMNKLDTGAIASSGYAYGLQARVYGRYEYEQFRQTLQDTIVGNTAAGVEIKSRLKGDAGLKAEYYLQGYNKGDYLAEAHWQPDTLPGMGMSLFFNARIQRFEPGYFQQNAFINHFRWENNFEKSGLFKIKAGLILPGYLGSVPPVIRVEYVNLAHPVYYDQSRLAQQSDESQRYLHLQLNGEWKFRHVHLSTELHYQKMLKGSVIRVPAFAGRASLFLQGYIFNKAMLARIGLDAGYNSYWLAPSYIPELAGFALQDSFFVGHYPVLDVWVSAKVKSFQFFAKMEHLNQGFSGYNYFMVPYYPLQPRTFRFGVQWTFYN